MKELEQGALHAAPLLLGQKLVRESPEGTTSGYIVEVEAYTYQDPASHTYKGQTLRNAAMFKEAGTIYVYFTYGMHFCLNIVTGKLGEGEGVLIRALQPVDGIELMQRRRGRTDLMQLTNGPAKLVQAMGVSRADNLTSLDNGPLRLEPGFVPEAILQTPRIGIKQAVELPWRFLVANNPYVSGAPRYNLGNEIT
jgi:DNA-3-methyladenine glycosylase